MHDERVQDPASRIPQIPSYEALADLKGDLPHPIPENLPAYTKKSSQYRHAETSVYPYLETNIDSRVMEFSQEPIEQTRSSLSIRRHGEDTPFRHHATVQKYVEGLIEKNGYSDLVEYNTTVERAEKQESGLWKLTLRKEGTGKRWDYWWTEEFDAILVASGHYTVPFIPRIQGLTDFAKAYPGAVEHSKGFRGSEKYRGKVKLPIQRAIRTLLNEDSVWSLSEPQSQGWI